MNTPVILAILILIASYFVFRKKASESFADLPPQRIPGEDNIEDMARRYEKQCSEYNVKLDPAKLANYPYNFSLDNALPSGQCPDSTFTFAADLSRVIPGAPRVPGCVQLKDEPYCYSMPDGTFRPWISRALQVTL